MKRVTRVTLFLAALLSAGAAFAADSPQQQFVRAWQGRIVTLRWPLYSLVYNERGKLGTTRNGLKEGLMVATPSQGAYLQFDGRQGRSDVVQKDPQQVVTAVNSAYEPDSLDLRSYRKLEAVAINRFEPGIEFIVVAVRVESDQVRVDFGPNGGGAAVTGITIKWPVPLSKTFTERTNVEELIQRFVDIKRP